MLFFLYLIVSADQVLARSTPYSAGETLNPDCAPGETNCTVSQTDYTATLAGKEPLISTSTIAEYWRGDKSWASLNKSVVGLGSVENTALSTWTGSTNITTLGTITSGVWNGSVIPVTRGGTGTTTALTAGSIVYAGTSGNFAQSNSQLYWDSANGYLGLGTAAPSSTLHVNGSISHTLRSVSSNYTLTANDNILLVDASSANLTITLPTASSVPGRMYIIKVISLGSLKTVTLSPASGQIEGASTLVMSVLYTSKQIISNGSAWYVIN